MNKFVSLMLVSITAMIVILNMSCSTQELNKDHDVSARLKYQNHEEELARMTAEAEAARIAINGLIKEGNSIIALQDDINAMYGSLGKFNKHYGAECLIDVRSFLEQKLEVLIKERKLLEDYCWADSFLLDKESLDKLLRKGKITQEEYQKRLDAWREWDKRHREELVK